MVVLRPVVQNLDNSVLIGRKIIVYPNRNTKYPISLNQSSTLHLNRLVKNGISPCLNPKDPVCSQVYFQKTQFIPKKPSLYPKTWVYSQIQPGFFPSFCNSTFKSYLLFCMYFLINRVSQNEFSHDHSGGKNTCPKI